MNETNLTTVGQIREFLAGTADICWTPEEDDQARYAFIRKVLARFDYRRLSRPDKGLIRVYLGRTSGYSRAQLARPIRQYLDCGRVVQRYAAPQAGFARTYTDADVRLLSEVDALHCTLSGLAAISVAHLYNLRKKTGYQRQRQVWTKTRPVAIAIGERRAPAPNNRPGYLRLDTVHQGDQDGVKGLYHINAVDCVTQYEAVATCERISEAFLIPVLAELLASFPFVIQGFHSDNGSEFINGPVVKLLNKLLIEEQTKSRSRHCNDNAQAESKNGAIVRKHLGYGHIPQRFAALVKRLRSRIPEPLRELPSAVPDRRNHHRRQGQSTQALSLQIDDDAISETQITPAGRTIPQTWHHLPTARCLRRRNER